MPYQDLVEIASAWASVATAAVALFGYGYYRFDKYRRRVTLERYLKCQKEASADKGQRSFTNIMAKTGLAEVEIFEASRTSKHIVRRIKTDPTGQWAADLLFEYDRNRNSN